MWPITEGYAVRRAPRNHGDFGSPAATVRFAVFLSGDHGKNQHAAIGCNVSTSGYLAEGGR